MDKNRPAIVYMATNLVNGKRYVGVTSLTLQIRINGHWAARDKTNSGYLLSRAMKKYGRDQVRFSVLKKCATFTAALDEEIRIISLLKPEYNLTAGGDGRLGIPMPEHQKKILSDWMKKNGQKVWAASSAAKSIPVIRLKDGMVFDSIKAAAQAHHLVLGAVASHLKGKTKTAGGHLFSYYTGSEVADPLHDEKVNKIRERGRLNLLATRAKRRKPVVCVTTGVRYSGVREAARETGVPYACMGRLVRNANKSWDGLKFEFEK